MSFRPLPEQLQEKAELELNEDPSRIQEDIDHIREWLSQQPHLIARTGRSFCSQRTTIYFRKC